MTETLNPFQKLNLKENRMVKLLEETLIKEVITQKNRKPIEVGENASIYHALQIMADNEILAVPVVNKVDMEYKGFVDVMDILTFALDLYTEGRKMEETGWQGFIQEIQKLDHKGVRFGLKPVKSIIDASNTDKWYPVYPHGTVMQLVEGMLNKGVHRVPVMNEENIFQQIITQSDVIQVIASNLYMLGGMGRRTVKELRLGTVGGVISMSINAQAIHAFYLMKANKVSAVAITHPSGAIVANLSAADIKGLVEQNFGALLLPIPQYLGVHGKSLRPPATCTLNTTFEVVILKMALYRVHRLWIVDDHDIPLGVISMTDVMQLFAKIEDSAA